MSKEEMKIRRYTPRTEEECRNAAICIIELKQENNQLKEEITRKNKLLNSIQEKYEDRDYRIEKAIEYINRLISDEYGVSIMVDEYSCEYECEWKEKILKILKGEENE